MAVLTRAALVLALWATADATSAHVAADPGVATAGAYQAVRFRVGHGCEGKATRMLRIEVPAALATVRAQPKPGWDLSFEKTGDKVVAVVWRGELPDAQFDEFALFMKLPPEAQTLYFPAVQGCDGGEARWTEIPAPGGDRPSHPAPALVVGPASTAPQHQH